MCNFQYTLIIVILCISNETALTWIQREFIDDSQYCFRLWRGAFRQQAIIWANIDPDLYRHMVSLESNELIN